MDMRELVDWLNETAYQYYTLDDPTVSDREWDEKYDELVRMERHTLEGQALDLGWVRDGDMKLS